MPELYSNLKRALSKAFVLSVLGTMLYVLFGAFSDVLISKNNLWRIGFFDETAFQMMQRGESTRAVIRKLSTPLSYSDV